METALLMQSRFVVSRVRKVSRVRAGDGSDGIDVFVKLGFPWRPVHHLTLRGVPAEYDLAVLKNDINLSGWGMLKLFLPWLS